MPTIAKTRVIRFAVFMAHFFGFPLHQTEPGSRAPRTRNFRQAVLGPRLDAPDARSVQTQYQLAQRVGVKREAIARWEVATGSRAGQLAAALGVTCEAFNQEPSQRSGKRPGRPRKQKIDGPKSPQGRPKK
jgi:hypothetical protein